MRRIIILVLFLVLTPVVNAATGYCTGHYVEQGPTWQDGLLQEGDVFEFWCELDAPAKHPESITTRVQWPNAEIVAQLHVPRELFFGEVVLFP